MDHNASMPSLLQDQPSLLFDKYPNPTLNWDEFSIAGASIPGMNIGFERMNDMVAGTTAGPMSPNSFMLELLGGPLTFSELGFEGSSQT